MENPCSQRFALHVRSRHEKLISTLLSERQITMRGIHYFLVTRFIRVNTNGERKLYIPHE